MVRIKANYPNSPVASLSLNVDDLAPARAEFSDFTRRAYSAGVLTTSSALVTPRIS